ncbi:MAG: hypothetical protein R3C59_15475 [Planctomycetaceae bacterium]
MSKAFLQFRTAFAGILVLLQLFLLPATHMLHLGCQHPHGDGRCSSTSGSEVAASTCARSHCCRHCSTAARPAEAADDQPTDSAPVHPPHDEDSCAVCQVAFAARIATAAMVDLTTTEPVCEFVPQSSQSVDPTPRYCVLSRGPPTFFGQAAA